MMYDYDHMLFTWTTTTLSHAQKPYPQYQNYNNALQHEHMSKCTYLYVQCSPVSWQVIQWVQRCHSYCYQNRVRFPHSTGSLLHSYQPIWWSPYCTAQSSAYIKNKKITFLPLHLVAWQWHSWQSQYQPWSGYEKTTYYTKMFHPMKTTANANVMIRKAIHEMHSMQLMQRITEFPERKCRAMNRIISITYSAESSTLKKTTSK